MIISHSKKFIFVRGYRNAGTSAQVAISALCDGQDIISEYNPADVPLIAAEGFRGEQNNCEADGSPIISFEGHWTLKKAYARFPEIANYDVIGMCRNPYERVYSFSRWGFVKYRYRSGLGALPVHPDMVRQYAKNALANMRKIITSTGHRANYDGRTTGKVTILRYEHLEDDLKSLFARYDAPMPKLLHLKSTADVLHLPWQEVLTRNEIHLINRYFKKDFEQYGYEML